MLSFVPFLVPHILSLIMSAAKLFFSLLVLLSYRVLGAPTDPPSDLVLRDYPSELTPRDVVQTVSDYLSNAASGVSKDDVIQGILPNYFQDIPSVSKIKSELGLNDTGISQLALEVLNIPLVPLRHRNTFRKEKLTNLS